VRELPWAEQNGSEIKRNLGSIKSYVFFLIASPGGTISRVVAASRSRLFVFRAVERLAPKLVNPSHGSAHNATDETKGEEDGRNEREEDG
jgi:hypothetical protein